jgi:hypothetical protein
MIIYTHFNFTALESVNPESNILFFRDDKKCGIVPKRYKHYANWKTI